MTQTQGDYMSKIICGLLFSLLSISVYAQSVNVELQDLDSKNGVSDMKSMIVTVRDSINKNWFGDIAVIGVKIDNTQTLSNRVEVGLMRTFDSGFSVRTAIGERYSGNATTGNYAYYLINPSFSLPLGNSGLVSSLGWRFRSSFQEGKNDQTRSWRAGLAYNLDKKNQVGIAYYIVDGTIEQRITGINFTRRFH